MNLNYKNSTINYTLSGKGPAVILLHGFLESLDMWQTIEQEINKTHTVLCIDLLGHGQTDCLGYVHTMDAMADAVLAVITQHEINSAHVIGHSMGGYVALAMAEKQPQLFDGLCLMNSTFEADDKARRQLRTRAIKMATTNYNNLVRLSFANLFAPESKLKFKDDFEKALQLALLTSVQGYIAAQEGMKIRPNRNTTFLSLTAKKLIITGRKDSLIDAEAIAKTIANTPIEHKELSEGHMSHIENKSELTYILKRFIEK